jgi:hypothetical protein
MPPTIDGKLKATEVQMTPEEWELHKDCETTKGRAHKWQWKFDIAAGRTSEDQAICVHCGKETTLRAEGVRGVSP